ncbi:MAG: hypothetical protein HZB38_03905 [Planctomycetes bacterium]|nr:hypothetical protein [Planctomycetota bacterium]
MKLFAANPPFSPCEIPPAPRVQTSWFVAIVLLALAWRVAVAVAMPALARDGVGYCWNARSLGREGLAALQHEEFNQHPLYAAIILAAHFAARAAGAPDSPLLWQHAGQAVSLLCGIAVVILCGRLAIRAARAVDPSIDMRGAGAWAMLLAALLPLNVALSADVMSEPLFLSLYLAGACLLVREPTPARSLGFGLFCGLAFLTRPEGATLAPALAAALLARRHALGWKRVSVGAVLAIAGFLVCAAPYWATIGGLSPKMSKQTVGEFVAAPAAAVPDPCRPTLAALDYQETAWYAAAPRTAYETVRAGRVVILLLAAPVLIWLRSRLLSWPLVGLTTAAAAHFMLCSILLTRHGYLDPRHMLLVVVLLIPASAALLSEGWRRLWPARRLPAIVFVAAAIVPLVVYAMRVPHTDDGHIPAIAAWIRSQPGVSERTILVGGSSQRRIAFYADIGFRAWAENAPSDDEKHASLVDHLVTWQPRADYFAIEIDPRARERSEIRKNDATLKRLLTDAAISARWVLAHEAIVKGDRRLQVYARKP